MYRRALVMIEGLGIEVSPSPLYDAYDSLIDFEFWARKNIGEYLRKTVHPSISRSVWPRTTGSCS